MLLGIEYNFLSNMVFLISYSTVFLLIGILAYKIYTFDRQRQQLIVKKQAHTDQLTGRGNRYLFNEVVDKLILKNQKFAVCFMDLDGFKQINDTMGHDAGDQLLIELANTFDKKLPKNAVAYRLGGDEFAIIIQKIKTTEDITNLLDNLKNEFMIPFIIEGTKISLEYSLGISTFPEDATTRQDLIASADDAMYYIKEHGKNDYYFHNKVLKAELDNKMKMQSDLKLAYENNEFNFSLQPRINIEDITKVGFEALLIWEHPVLGEINAEYFIKQAEEMNLIIKLDQLVLEKACQKLEFFSQKGYEDVKISLNISNKHALKKDFVDKLCEIIKAHSLKSGQIQIELINNIDVKNIELYKSMFEKLKACGAEIVVNNIELKYEVLSLFKSLPIDELKISADYISENSDTISKEILSDIIKIGKHLKYKIIITKIEDKESLDCAIVYNADKIQGKLLFKNMQEELSEEFLSGYDKYQKTLKDIISKAKKLALK
ncbi:MAG: EAL domain-containing protein [Clostridia bacterium]